MKTPASPNVYREPPWTKVYFAHVIGTAFLGALLPAGEQLKGIHSVTQPFLQWFPGAVSISSLAPDPIFAQAFLALSMLVALCMVIGTVWHVSRGGYHTKTFESQSKRLVGILLLWGGSVLVIAALWSISYSVEGAQTPGYFFIKAAISSEVGVLTAMNQIIVGIPLFLTLFSTIVPFCTKANTKV